MISEMPINSHHRFERSLKNYRSKYIHHLNYWKNSKKTNYWITFENPLSNYLDIADDCQFHANLSFNQDILSPTESTDSGIQLPMEIFNNTDEDRTMKIGWERCEDEQGVYYWHKRTGTVTRHRPDCFVDDSPFLTPSCSSTSSNENCFEIGSLLNQSESDNSIKTFDEHRSQHRFYVRPLGSTIINEEDLLNGRCSRTVNRCIAELSRQTDDSIHSWTDGNEILMEIDRTQIVFIDPNQCTLVQKQSIPAIRVWAVGRENSRDFAYVAKDKTRSDNTYKCHVFRCENVSARVIGEILKEICRNLMAERGLLASANHSSNDVSSTLENPLEFSGPTGSFPSAHEETQKNLHCQYLGWISVDKAGGMDVLRPAIERLSMSIERNRWIPVTMNISPTTINVCSNDNCEEKLIECRIRYLSFLGVGKDTSFCGLIIHCADNSFRCHVFHCRPSCIELCRNLEAACKLRFQKCLDAHPPMVKRMTPSTSYSAQLKNLVESFWWKSK